MGFIKEFKEFALKGNLIDMAVGVVIGTAFTKLVSAFIDGIVMPPIGKLMGNMNFSELYYSISPKVDLVQKAAGGNLSLAEAKKIGPVIAYGNFLTMLIDFLIVAFVVFMVIKMMNRLKRKEEAAPATPPPPSKEELLLTEIRDILKNK
ncbi:MAG: large conductance mechanosensitive channel [Bacteroidetes bacterium]|nr:MAG: large conductance mechanosensitive channel [Bacteroidota bacterium]